MMLMLMLMLCCEVHADVDADVDVERPGGSPQARLWILYMTERREIDGQI